MSAKSSMGRKSILLAVVVAILFFGWMLSGVLGNPAPTENTTETNQAEATMRVSVSDSRARTTTRTISAAARTHFNRGIELRAETTGRVIAIGAERGASISQGDNVVRIDIRDRMAQLAEAEAMIRQRQLEFEAAEQLRGEQFMSPSELAGREAALESARAARERITIDIARTEISAPFDAVVYDRLVEIGDYLAPGDSVAQLIDVDPLIVVADINEREIGAISVGQTGTAFLQNGPSISGRIRYISPAASETTRSFQVEMEIPNPDGALPVGTSARLELEGESISAHEISPGLLTLADDGTIGVKIIDSDDRVRFVPVEIADSTANAALVTGLPDQARIITVGQGFVDEGQLVIPDVESPDSSRAP